MVDWLLLLCLVPALVVPVVLMSGFAGCDLVWGLEGPPELENVAAEGINTDTIRLKWTKPSGRDRVSLSRRAAGEPESSVPILITADTYDDVGLLESKTYFYDLIAYGPGVESPPVRVNARTLGPSKVFETQLTARQANQGGRCCVQRIEPIRLFNAGNRLRLTVAAPADGPVFLQLVTISGATGPDRYDAGSDLTTVATDVFVPASAIIALPIVTYALDRTVPLLIAFDIGSPGNLAYLPNVPAGDGSAFLGDGHAAGQQDRPSGFVERDRFYLVTKIEVV